MRIAARTLWDRWIGRQINFLTTTRITSNAAITALYSRSKMVNAFTAPVRGSLYGR